MMRIKKHKPYTALKRALAGKGIKYVDVAQLLGITENAIQLKINGTSDFYLSEQQKVCEAYALDANIFFEEIVA
jgi:hypothetical protein